VRRSVKQRLGAGGKHGGEERWSAGDAREDDSAWLGLGQWSSGVRREEREDEEGMKGGPHRSDREIE
jgi:hypothetical protein